MYSHSKLCAGIVADVKKEASNAAQLVLAAMERRFETDSLQKAFQLFQPSTWTDFAKAKNSERADLRSVLRQYLTVLQEMYATPINDIAPLVDDVDLDMEWDSFEVMMESSAGKLQ